MAARDERARRLAKNEALLRAANESINAVAGQYAYALGEHVYEFVCECADSECLEPVALSVREYEQVRSKGDRFALVAGHEDSRVESVVERHGGYAIVEKFGEASAVARELDPRG